MQLELKNLAGQLAKLMLEQAKSMRKVYEELPEAEQQAVIENTETLGVQLVENVKDLILSQGGGVADITIHKVGINKETVEAKISMDRDDELAKILMGSAHSPGKLTFVNVGREATNLGKRAQPTPSQGGMFTDKDEDEPYEPEQPIAAVDDKKVTKLVPKSAEVAESTKPKATTKAKASKPKTTTKPKSPTKSKAAPKTVARRRVAAKKPEITELTSDG